jgi:hypothetical protein
MPIRWRAVSSLSVAVLAAIACSSTQGTQPSAQTTSQVVGASGGTVTAADGTQVAIPPGALPGDVTITIAPNPLAPALTQGISIAPAHLFGPEGQQFLAPVTVTLAFASASLPPSATEQQILVYTAPQGSGDYQPLPTTLVDATHVAGQTTHFSNVCPGVPHVGGDAGGDSAADAATCPAASGIENADGARDCASKSCCAQLTTCVSDPACSPIGACFEANCQAFYTGDDAQLLQCAAQCAADGSASGASEFNAAFNCIHTSCGGGVDGGGVVDSGGSTDGSSPTDATAGGDAGGDAATCPAASGITDPKDQACASQSCCSQLTACVSDPACSPIATCFDSNCQSSDAGNQSIQQCAAQCAADGSANGVSEFNAAFNCIQSSCFSTDAGGD